MLINRIFTLILFISIAASAPLLASEAGGDEEAERELIYTYLGPIAGGGFNRITYNDWFETFQGTRQLNGVYFSGGLLIAVYGQYFMGDFSVQFMYNSGGLTIYHLHYASTARFHYRFNQYFGFTPGAGIYLETPPSNQKYQGSAGLTVPIGFYLNTSFNTRLVLDLLVNYGIFGLGEDSRRLSFGIRLGFIFKVGRI